MENNGPIPSVGMLATELIEAIDNLTAKISTENEVIEVIKTIISDKKKRLKILDGDKAKSKFAALMGKGRLEKFYPLLERAIANVARG
jgi:translation initiation factor IF-1